MRQRHVAIGGEVELREDDLRPLREVDAGHDGGQRQRHIDRDGELVGIGVHHLSKGVLEARHLREDVVHPHGVGSPFGGPGVDVLLQVTLGPKGDGPERRADQVGLRPDDRELVAIPLEVGHFSCFSR